MGEVLAGRKLPIQIPCMTQKSPVHFLLREKYGNLATDNVIELILSFIKDFMGDESSNSDDSVT